MATTIPWWTDSTKPLRTTSATTGASASGLVLGPPVLVRPLTGSSCP
ncbi:hypothetical protein [Ornithinimicrobium kibberense]